MINFNSTSFVTEAAQLLAVLTKEIVGSKMCKRTKLKHLKEKCAGYGFMYEKISKDMTELTVRFFCRNVESKIVIKVGDIGTTITLDFEDEMFTAK